MQASAKKYGYEIIEINLSQPRSSAALRRQFLEATQSQRVSLRPSGSGGDAEGAEGGKGIDSKKKPGRPKTKKKKKPRRSSELPPPPEHKKLTLILIEDVDVALPECDAGFHAGVRELARRAKCPVVLTAAAPAGHHLDLSNQHLVMEPPSLAELTYLLALIANAEGLQIKFCELEALALLCSCDMRASILALQAYGPSHLHCSAGGDGGGAKSSPSFPTRAAEVVKKKAQKKTKTLNFSLKIRVVMLRNDRSLQ